MHGSFGVNLASAAVKIFKNENSKINPLVVVKKEMYENGDPLTVVAQAGGGLNSPVMAEDQTRKREMRLLKNREAARECRRKKKEYIKCLENRVAVLENQNKALIDELKSLKELYCQQKTD